MQLRRTSPVLTVLVLAVAIAAAAAGLWPAPAAAADTGADITAASDPVLSWVLAVPDPSRVFASALGLSESELASAQSIGRRLEAAETSALAESDQRLDRSAASPVATAEADRYNLEVGAMQQGAIRDIAAATGSSETSVTSALSTAWAQQVATYDEAQAHTRLAASLGVISYRVTATSFGGITGRGVAVPDKYVKFAAKGWRTSIPAEYQTAYPAGKPYAVGLAYGSRTVASAPVVDVGPWNTDDNYWNSRFDPTRPRRSFKDVAQGTPEAAAALFNGYNGGKDQFGRKVLNAAGIDLLNPTWADLGANISSGGYKDWVTVWFLWEPGSSLPPVAEGRLYGKDRYTTSLAVSRRGWKTATSVVLATGADFPDALCAAPLADTYGGPVLLVNPRYGMTAELRAEMVRLAPKRVFIVGGSGSVPAGMDAQCKALPSAPAVQRIAGKERAATAAGVARVIEASTGGIPRVIVATGWNYPDALAAAPIGAANHWPVLLVTRDGVPADTAQVISDLKIPSSVVIGGTGVISAKVMSAMPAPVRVFGRDRYETAARLGGYAETHGCSFAYVGITSGESYPDALAAGSYVALRHGILSLVQPRRVPDYTATMLKYKGSSVAAADAVGGTSVVSDAVMTTVHKLFRP